jgi:hypothetical protein
MKKSLVTILTAVVLGAASGAQAASPTRYSLSIEVRPQTHSIHVEGLWTVPAEDFAGGDKAGPKHLEFVSSEKLVGLRLSYGGRDAPVRCHPDRGQLACSIEIAAPQRPAYVLRLMYDSDGVDVAQLRIDEDQAFAGSSGDYWYPELTSVQGDRADLRIDFKGPLLVLVDADGASSTTHVPGVAGVYRASPDPDHAMLWMPGLCD